MIDACDRCHRERTPGGGHLIDNALLCPECFMNLPACGFCGAPRATETHREELFPAVPCCADEDACHARVLRDDPDPQGETVRLFQPAPASIPGQLNL